MTFETDSKVMFDCKRGLRGDFVTLDEDGPDRFWPPDPAKVHMDIVRPGSYADSYYQGICLRVMHAKPYSPK